MSAAVWIKAWADTRWKFTLAALLFTCLTIFIVLEWPTIQSLLPLAAGMKVNGIEGRQIEESLKLSSTYSGYIWGNLFQGNLRWFGIVFALLLGTGSFSAPGGRFWLSLPVLRSQWLLSRVGMGLVELFLICLIPSILLPLVSPAVGQTYAFGSALLHGLSLFVYLSVFLSLAALLSSFFEDIWKPVLLGLAVAVTLGISEYVVPDQIYSVLSVETLTGRLLAAFFSMALAFAAVQRLERQDF